MPELPEVETVRRWLAPALTGASLSRVELRRPDLRYPIPVDAVQAQVGRQVRAVRRRAKYLLLDTQGVEIGSAPVDTDSVAAGPLPADAGGLLIHLGMSGRCWLEAAEDLPSDEPPPWRKHEHWRMWLTGEDGVHLLRYQDARRFGALDVVTNPADHRLLVKLGYEPFDPGFNGAWLYQTCRGRKTAIKALLMDAKRVVGVGNIYASEACYRAGVHPLKPAGRVGKAAAARLVVAVRAVLAEAIAAGGSTLKDFVGGDENPGYFQQRLDVYGRTGQPCHRCTVEDGAKQGAAEVPTVRRATHLGRATFFCGRCQR